MPIVTQASKSRQSTLALLRSLGIQHGYYNPADWKSAGMIDMLVETYTDVFNGFAKVLFSAENEKAGGLEALKNGLLGNFLKMVENQLETQTTNKFIMGNQMTIADFAMSSFLFNIMKNDHGPFSASCSAMLLEYPHIGAYSKRLESELKSHLTNRPNCPF